MVLVSVYVPAARTMVVPEERDATAACSWPSDETFTIRAPVIGSAGAESTDAASVATAVTSKVIQAGASRLSAGLKRTRTCTACLHGNCFEGRLGSCGLQASVPR